MTSKSIKERFSKPIRDSCSATKLPTLPRPTIPTLSRVRRAWLSCPQTDNVRLNSVWYCGFSTRASLNDTLSCFPTDRTVWHHRVRNCLLPMCSQKRPLHVPSVPTVKPTRGSSVKLDTAPASLCSAAMSSALIACQPGTGWLCIKAIPALCCIARAHTRSKYCGLKLAFPWRCLSPCSGNTGV